MVWDGNTIYDRNYRNESTNRKYNNLIGEKDERFFVFFFKYKIDFYSNLI